MSRRHDRIEQETSDGRLLKQAEGSERVWLSGVRLEGTLEMNTSRHVAPNGEQMLLPRRYRWHIGDEGELTATVDSDWIYGVGHGWISGVNYSGTLRGKEVAGRGYVEWVDVRTNAA